MRRNEIKPVNPDWAVSYGVPCVVCPACEFTFEASHDDGTCPVCALVTRDVEIAGLRAELVKAELHHDATCDAAGEARAMIQAYRDQNEVIAGMRPVVEAAKAYVGPWDDPGVRAQPDPTLRNLVDAVHTYCRSKRLAANRP
jgi:hypothetical protein